MQSSKKKKLLVVGAGAQARYIINTVSLLPQFELLGLLDTFGNEELWGKEINAVPVLGSAGQIEKLAAPDTTALIMAVSDLKQKRTLVSELTAKGFEFVSIIHPSTVIAASVTIGKGTLINAGCVIEPNAVIGEHVIIHAGSVIEHDNRVGDYVNIGPGVKTAGRVEFEEGATVYTGAVIIPGKRIGREAIVGAGAVVIDDVAARTTVVGVPARVLR